MLKRGVFQGANAIQLDPKVSGDGESQPIYRFYEANLNVNKV